MWCDIFQPMLSLLNLIPFYVLLSFIVLSKTISISFQSLRNSSSLAEIVAQYSRTALSWQNGEDEDSIRKFLTLPKATVEFKQNMEKRKRKIRQILIPNADASFSLISISSINTSNNDFGGKRGNSFQGKAETKYSQSADAVSLLKSRRPTEKYLGRTTCVLPPLVQGKSLRAPRSRYQLQYLSKLDESLQAATLLPKEEHKTFSTCLRSFSVVSENPV